MKYIIKVEELAQTILGIGVLSFLSFQFSWWLWMILFLSPDIAILGYAISKKTGGVIYNIFHHKGLAIAVAITGFFLKEDTLILAGTLLFTHASFDRIWGYGLKYPDDFKHTHLGWMK
jgi:multidrug transporter EmrE-like cation transporter